MILNVQIKLNTVFIGSRKLDEQNHVRKIARSFEDSGAIKLFTRRLRHLFYKYATEELHIDDYSYDTIKSDGTIRLVNPDEDKSGIHVRKFYDKLRRCEVTEHFEAYSCGTKMYFELFVDESQLTENQVKKILSYIGKYDGISQFGFNWGYGKFDVVSVTRLNDKEVKNIEKEEEEKE